MLKYILLLITLASLGCGAGDATKAAQQTTDGYFKALAAKDWSKAQECFSEPFFTQVNKEAHAKLLDSLTAKMGEYRSHQLNGFKYMTGTSTHTTLVYTVHYANGKTKETFIYTGQPADDKYLITRHNIESPDLLKPVQ